MDVSLLIKRTLDSETPPPAPNEILAAMRQYPFFYPLGLAWLRRTANEGLLAEHETRLKIGRLVAQALPSMTHDNLYMIADLTGGDETDENFYPLPDKPQAPDTEEAIGIFLDKYSPTGQSEHETQILEKLIFNPVPDYSAILAEEEKASMPTDEETIGDTNDALLNKFIISSASETAKEKSVNSDSPVTTPPPLPVTLSCAPPRLGNQDISFTESLAKTYIKRKNYSSAFEIISKLNLKYPEKSIYFAVQLRFLEKLMLNEKLKANLKTTNKI